MNCILRSIILVASLGSCLGADLITWCNQTSPCSCDTNLGEIDISPLALKGKPGLTTQKGDLTFYYNPCTNFDIGPLKDTSLVLKNGSETYLPIGNNIYVKFVVVDGHAQIQTLSTYLLNSKIDLSCAHSTEFIFLNEKPKYYYNFELHSPYACATDQKLSSFSTLSIGYIILIIVIAVIFVYLVGGMAFQKCARNAQGRDIIPHVDFWTSIPGHIKNGVMFVFTCGRREPKFDDIN